MTVTTDPPVVSLTGVGKTFTRNDQETTVALEAIDLTIGQGEFVDDRQQVDARRASRAQDFGDDGFTGIGGTGKTQDLDDNLIFGPGTLGSRIANRDRGAPRVRIA